MKLNGPRFPISATRRFPQPSAIHGVTAWIDPGSRTRNVVLERGGHSVGIVLPLAKDLGDAEEIALLRQRIRAVQILIFLQVESESHFSTLPLLYSAMRTPGKTAYEAFQMRSCLRVRAARYAVALIVWKLNFSESKRIA